MIGSLFIMNERGEVLIENPPDYGAFGLWATNPRTGQRDEANPYAQKRLQPRHAQENAVLAARAQRLRLGEGVELLLRHAEVVGERADVDVELVRLRLKLLQCDE